MAIETIPKEIQQEADDIIDAFNRKHFSANTVAFFAELKGKFLYLKRKEYGKISPIARLTYIGDIKEWGVANWLYLNTIF